MHSKEIEDYKKTLKLTKQQREIIVGLMLGDGHLETMNDGKTYRLKIEHSIKQQEYVDWLYQIWKDWVRTEPKNKTRSLNGTKVTNLVFNTLSHGSLRFYGQQFYPNGKKIVPKLIHKWLTPQAFAIWFMDDGSIKSKHHHARILNTQGFTKKEVTRLIEVLEKNFNLQASLRKQREGYQIMIRGASAQALRALLDPYILPSMRYKLPPEKRLTPLPKR